MKPRFTFFLLGLLLATVGAAQTTRVIAFGDSLTRGVGDNNADCDSDFAGYPARLPNALQSEGHSVVVVNEGICGETTMAGVTRIDVVLDDAQAGDIVILMEGTNDIHGLGSSPVRARRPIPT